MADDIQHYRELIRATRERLKALEIQKAQFGFSTPPHIDNEIAECHKDIEVYNALLWEGAQPSEKAKNEVPGDPDVLLLKYQVVQLREFVKDALTSPKNQQKETSAAVQAQITYNNEEAVRWRAEERQQRKAGQERNEERLSNLEVTTRGLREWQENITSMFRSWSSRIAIITLLIIVALAAFYIGAHR